MIKSKQGDMRMQYYIYSLVCFLLPGTVWLVWNRRMIADKAYKVRHIIWVYIYMFYGYLAVQEAAGIGSIWDLITYGNSIFFRRRNDIYLKYHYVYAAWIFIATYLGKFQKCKKSSFDGISDVIDNRNLSVI